MDLRLIPDSQKSQYNKLVSHIMQSWEWGEFRKRMGLKVLRYGLYNDNKLLKAFQLTIHPIPFTNYYVGYLPKGPAPDKNLSDALIKIGSEQNCAFIKVEPNVIASTSTTLSVNEAKQSLNEKGIASSSFDKLRTPRNDEGRIIKEFHPSPKPLFTKHNFIIDLTKSEEELLKNMHPKTRYNIKVAEKHGVTVEERVDTQAFKIYLKLYFETTKRQSYHGHNEDYHRKVWETLKDAGMARLLVAFFSSPTSHFPLPLTAWMLLSFKDTLYYPYGGSSKSHPEVMANNLVCWEGIKLGKKLGLKTFDMWGALEPNANSKDPWYGFHRFKQGYGGQLVEYVGTYDLVLNWPIYLAFTTIDKLLPLKVFLLKLFGK